MKALLITPEKQTIGMINIDNHDDIVSLIGYDTLESDRLYFNEECFLRGSSGRFQIDMIIPVSGKGVIVSSTDDGGSLCDAVSDIEGIKQRLKYL